MSQLSNDGRSRSCSRIGSTSRRMTSEPIRRCPAGRLHGVPGTCHRGLVPCHDRGAMPAMTEPDQPDQPAAGEVVGRVIGTDESTPLEFWVAIGEGSYLQLDDVVALQRTLPDGTTVK